MRPYAAIFPGQGSQHREMLLSYLNNNTFINTLNESSEILKFDIVKTVEDESKLNNTIYTQPIMLATSIAIWRTWREKNESLPSYAAGHSLGEYSALVASQIISLSDGLNLVSERAKMMVEAMGNIEGSMAAIIGLNSNQVNNICKELSIGDNVIEAVNFNSDSQIVVAGDVDTIKKSENVFKSTGAKIVKVLPVSVAAHTSIMKNCSEKLNKLLLNIEFKEPLFPVIHNEDAQSKIHKDDIIVSLTKQIHSSVMWSQSIKNIAKLGIDSFIEIGPGTVLTGLNKRISKELSVISISDSKLIDDAKELIINGN
ncbi:MAG: [acyl-carrier-protein] S-malonyltransferase [Gammaproteobacteria bacterium]|nr:[acyl-carrier-protein] S-malonyltransferase [Gammaproteobacteria bacterium]|tara:strand:- start:457 stop:1395 length:939 start_codon:yes stop_codon:yes gene_type:complete